jgi:DNA-directed RNA polymerase subunit K/omega
MIYPSIDDLTAGKINRYELAVATAKCARVLTDEYTAKRDIAEKLIANKETDKSLAAILKLDQKDEKSVKTAINKIYNGDYVIESRR